MNCCVTNIKTFSVPHVIVIIDTRILRRRKIPTIFRELKKGNFLLKMSTDKNLLILKRINRFLKII